MENELTRQYVFLRSSRGVLLDYCHTLAPDDFTRELKDFGRGSIRNLLVHITNTYWYWLGAFAQNRHIDYTEASAVGKVTQAEPLFENTDRLVQEFLTVFDGKYNIPVNGIIRGQEVSATPLKLFTHVLTHEFHHKGQILSMSRHLGYIPPDTDVMR